MEFESIVGDLSSIKKVEKRVLTSMADINGEANEAAQLIERYKVFDLWPCSKEELLIYGLSETLPKSAPNAGGGGSHLRSANAQPKSSLLLQEKVKKTVSLASPDVSQLTPFKPTYHYHPGEHRIQGGVFPMPPAAADICTRLPPPRCFEGPYVILDHLMRTLTSTKIPSMEKAGRDENVHKDNNGASSSGANKRKMSRDVSDNEDEDDIPTNDLYRKRQQRRIK